MHRNASQTPEVTILTPTLETKLAALVRREEGLFVHVPLPVLARVTPLGVHASFLFLILYSLHRMAPSNTFFPMRANFEDVVGKDRRWWYRHTQALERAGLIEVRRGSGAGTRYRVMV